MAAVAVAGINYMTNLDGEGRSAVDRFHQSAEEVAVRLERAARRVRQTAEDVGIGPLAAAQTLDRDLGQVALIPSLDHTDLLPDMVRSADYILGEVQSCVGNLPLTRLAQAGRDAQAGFRRCPPTVDIEGA